MVDGTEAGRISAAHGNLLAYMRLLATTVGGEVEEGPGHLAFAGAHEYPGTYTNGVVRTVTEADATLTPAELLAHSDAFFGRWERPYVVWVRAQDDDLDAELRRRGAAVRPPAEGSPAIFRGRDETSPFEVRVPPGVLIAETSDEDDLRAYLRLVAVVYDMPDADLSLVESVLCSLASLRHPDSHVYLARDSDTGQLLGGVTTYLANGGMHSAWCVADPAIRGRGVGSALLPYSARHGFELGAEFLWGVASQKGAPLWNKIGFRTLTTYKRYMMPAPRPVALAATQGRGRRGAAARAVGSEASP